MSDDDEELGHGMYYFAKDGTYWLTPEERDAWEKPDWKVLHFERAQELLRKVEELMADEDRFREMGYGVCKFYVDLAQLHLRIRDLL